MAVGLKEHGKKKKKGEMKGEKKDRKGIMQHFNERFAGKVVELGLEERPERTVYSLTSEYKRHAEDYDRSIAPKVKEKEQER